MGGGDANFSKIVSMPFLQSNNGRKAINITSTRCLVGFVQHACRHLQDIAHAFQKKCCQMKDGIIKRKMNFKRF